MRLQRRYVLGGLLALSALVTAALLSGVLGTVFFAITVVYVLLPLRRMLSSRGLSRWWASVVATLAAFVAVLALTAPLVAVTVFRLPLAVEALDTLPNEFVFDQFGYTHTVTLEEVFALLARSATSLARTAARSVPVLLVKFTLFTLLVFSLLLNASSTRQSLLAVVPHGYRDIANAFHRRTRETLYAIYVLQAATAVGTFFIAVPVFYLLGYRFFVTLATISAILQFVPIVGPSFLLAALAGYQAFVGDPTGAALTFFVGGFFIAWLPDILIRPRLAAETANLPGSLYFVGFVGGVLSMGAIGFIAGPLAVALVAEAAQLLSTDLNGVPVDEEG